MTSSKKVFNRLEFGKTPLIFTGSQLHIPCGDHIASLVLDIIPDEQHVGKSNTNVVSQENKQQQQVVESTEIVEQAIPFQFWQALLGYGDYEEDDIFQQFTNDLKDHFFTSKDVSERLKGFESQISETEGSSGSDLTDFTRDRSYTQNELLVSKTGSSLIDLIPLNQVKLRELKRKPQVDKHVRDGTPFCGLDLMEPVQVQIPLGNYVSVLMKHIQICYIRLICRLAFNYKNEKARFTINR